MRTVIFLTASFIQTVDVYKAHGDPKGNLIFFSHPELFVHMFRCGNAFYLAAF